MSNIEITFKARRSLKARTTFLPLGQVSSVPPPDQLPFTFYPAFRIREIDMCVYGTSSGLFWPLDPDRVPPMKDPHSIPKSWEGGRMRRKNHEVSSCLFTGEVTTTLSRWLFPLNSLFCIPVTFLYPLRLGAWVSNGSATASGLPCGSRHPAHTFVSSPFIGHSQIMLSLLCHAFPLGPLNDTSPFSS